MLSTNIVPDIWYVLIYVCLGSEESINMDAWCYTCIILKSMKIRELKTIRFGISVEKCNKWEV